MAEAHLSRVFYSILTDDSFEFDSIRTKVSHIFFKLVFQAMYAILHNSLNRVQFLIRQISVETRYQKFILATLRMFLHLRQNKLQKIQERQIQWYDRVDKFPQQSILYNFIGLFFQILGDAYYQLHEYEISASFYLKSNSYFRYSEPEQYLGINHKKISNVYLKAGYIHEANYHKLESEKYNIPVNEISFVKKIEPIQ